MRKDELLTLCDRAEQRDEYLAECNDIETEIREYFTDLWTNAQMTTNNVYYAGTVDVTGSKDCKNKVIGNVKAGKSTAEHGNIDCVFGVPSIEFENFFILSRVCRRIDNKLFEELSYAYIHDESKRFNLRAYHSSFCTFNGFDDSTDFEKWKSQDGHTTLYQISFNNYCFGFTIDRANNCATQISEDAIRMNCTGESDGFMLQPHGKFAATHDFECNSPDYNDEDENRDIT